MPPSWKKCVKCLITFLDPPPSWKNYVKCLMGFTRICRHLGKSACNHNSNIPHLDEWKRHTYTRAYRHTHTHTAVTHGYSRCCKSFLGISVLLLELYIWYTFCYYNVCYHSICCAYSAIREPRRNTFIDICVVDQRPPSPVPRGGRDKPVVRLHCPADDDDG